jgi:hypothetical protein
MRTAAPREGQDHATLLPDAGAFIAVLVLAALAAASPQPTAAQAAPPCTAVEDDAERLACYDRALRTPSPSAPAPAAQAPAQNPPASAPPATSPAPAATAEPRSERRIRNSAAPAAPAAPVAGDSGDDDDDDKIIPIVIIGVGARAGRETVFTAQDGATWVQTDTQRLGNLPDPPFEAELKPGTLGSYFLVPKEQGRAIRVRNATR